MNIIVIKSFELAKLSYFFAKSLRDIKEFELASQILRSGSSIGANISESISAESRKDFTHKLQISLKEARELNYWLKLVEDVLKIKDSNLNALCNEIQAILAKSIITLKKKPKF